MKNDIELDELETLLHEILNYTDLSQSDTLSGKTKSHLKAMRREFEKLQHKDQSFNRKAILKEMTSLLIGGIISALIREDTRYYRDGNGLYPEEQLYKLNELKTNYLKSTPEPYINHMYFIGNEALKNLPLLFNRHIFTRKIKLLNTLEPTPFFPQLAKNAEKIDQLVNLLGKKTISVGLLAPSFFSLPPNQTDNNINTYIEQITALYDQTIQSLSKHLESLEADISKTPEPPSSQKILINTIDTIKNSLDTIKTNLKDRLEQFNNSVDFEDNFYNTFTLAITNAQKTIHNAHNQLKKEPYSNSIIKKFVLDMIRNVLDIIKTLSHYLSFKYINKETHWTQNIKKAQQDIDEKLTQLEQEITQLPEHFDKAFNVTYTLKY